MVSGVKSWKGRHSHSSRSRKIIAIQTEMAELEAIQTEVIKQLSKQAMSAVMVMTEAGSWPTSDTNIFNLKEAHKHRHGRKALRQPSFNWNTADKYVKLLGLSWKSWIYFRQRHTHYLRKDNPYYKEVGRARGIAVNANIYKFWERGMKNSGRAVFHTRWKIQTAPQWNDIVLAIL